MPIAGEALLTRPEWRVLLAAVHPASDRLVPSPLPDWPELLRLARRHGLVYLLTRWLDRHPELQVPAEIRAELTVRSRSHVQRCLSLGGAAGQLLADLQRQGVTARVFKGPALALQAYGNGLARGYNDIDLLVRTGQFSAAVEFLSRSGFGGEVPLTPAVLRYFERSRRDLVLSKNGLSVDLHQQFFRGPGFFRLTRDQWLDAEELSLHGFPLTAPAPALLLPVLCAHAAYHGWERLRDLADVARLAAALTPEQWRRAAVYAGEMKIRALFRTGLLLVSRFFELQLALPPELSRPDRRAAAWADHYAATLLQDGAGLSEWQIFFGFCRHLDTPWARLRYFCFFLFSPRPVHFEREPHLSGPLFFRRLVHPWRLWREYWRQRRRAKTG